MITEAQIEATISKLISEEIKDDFAVTNLEYWNYLNSDGFKGLSEEENQVLFFINSVIYHVIKEHQPDDWEFELEAFQNQEDSNWELRNDLGDWSKVLDTFFEKNPKKEDLYAFVEDMLEEDEEALISEIGKEVIFITSISYIDMLVPIG